MSKIENYIGGEFVQPASGEYLDNYDPALGAVYSQVADSDDRDVHLAVESAKTAFSEWSRASAESRHDIMLKNGLDAPETAAREYRCLLSGTYGVCRK